MSATLEEGLASGRKKEASMLYTLAIVLLVLWALGFFAFHVGGGLIHLLIVIAIVMIVINLVSGRRGRI
jgi:tryptophan-rich sensory protein